MNESLAYKTEKKIYDLLPHEPEMIATTLFIIAMACYYLWRMFAITPQYDELYTYYTFISRGPIYAAIHWPLPNNHVGYSVLSAILDYTGNSYIGLRGVSYLCAVSNLILIYRISKRYYSHGLSYGAVVLYSAMQIVTEYSVQGRGYTLATTCFLMSVYVAGKICSADDTPSFYYISLAISFILGLYTVPTSIYWVIPISFAIGIYLLINAFKSKAVRGQISASIYYRKFCRFFVYGLAAAIITILLYAIIWLAIGSNLLVKDSGSSYYGLSHLDMLLKSPFAALKRGIDYMLSQPYIQSMPAKEFNAKFIDWCLSLYNYMLPGMKYLVAFVIVCSVIIALAECIRHLAYSRTFINLVVVTTVFSTGIILLLQHKLPYLRVFSYGAVIVVWCFCTCIESLTNFSIRQYNSYLKFRSSSNREKIAHKESETAIKDDRWYSGIGVYIPVVMITALFVFRVCSYDFNVQLGSRENDVFNTLYIADVGRRHNIAVLDCDQQYLLKFGWDIDCEKTDVDGADCVIIDKNLVTPGYNGPDFWKFYQTYETINWDYIDTMRAIYENENFILYVK